MQSEIIHLFKEKSKKGNVLGYFSKTTDSSLIEASGFSGLDFVILDMEHGPIGVETLKHHLMACKSAGLISIVRVNSCNSELIGKALDLGANGIQVPNINSAEQARQAVRLSKFHPSGERGVCRFVRGANYASMDRFDYFKDANSNLIVIQLEGIEGVKSFNSIIEVPGIDYIFIGPYDLSQSLGFPGQIEHPEVLAYINDLVKKAAQKNVMVGTFCDTPGSLIKWKKMGLNYLAYSVDISIFREKLQDINNLRNQN